LELQGTGESLLNPRLEEIVETATGTVKEITLITNASLLNDANIRLFVRANVQLVVSLDGPIPALFRFIGR
jgi:wyosine [tRNA(Phe)-imidazoG37] synthetase (radical SAM superfamily)